MINRLLLQVLILFIFVFYPSQFVYSQTTGLDKDKGFRPNTIGLSPYKKRLFDYLEIERHFLNQKYSKPSTTAWIDYTRMYEEYVLIFCYPQVLTSKHPKLSLNCEYYISKLEKYHPDNTYIPCVRKGVKSKECRNSYLNQYISRNESLTTSSNNILQLEQKIAEIHSDKLEIDNFKLTEELEKAQTKYKQKQNPQTWLALKEKLTDSINYHCKEHNIRYVNFDPPDYLLASNLLDHEKYANDRLYMQVYELLNDPNRLGNLIAKGYFDRRKKKDKNRVEIHPFEDIEAAPPVVFQPNPFWRIRTIKEKCYQNILAGLKFNNYFPPAICGLHSTYAPFCGEAEEKFREHLPHYIIKPPEEKHTFQMDDF